MKPTHPVELICCAIATEEGAFTPGTMPQIRNNPGDLRFANQLGAQPPVPANRAVQPIAEFDSLPHGVTALFRQVWLYVAEGKTIREIIAAWAPPNENDTSAYLQNVLSWTGLDADTPVLQLLPPLVQLNRETT